MMPDSVYVLWWTGLILTIAVFIPLVVYLLHRTWIAASTIRRYASETLEAAAGIVRGTESIGALDNTIAAGGAMIARAEMVAAKLDTAANVLAQRAE
ncbi:MAG: hypothetical protein ACT4OZ_03280 [Gemmatimonadota bacterium]